MRVKWITLALSLVSAAILVAAPFLSFEDRTLNFREVPPTGMISVMQIDAFEGGTGSRAEWLKRRAVEFEAANPGVFVEVSTGSPEQLAERIAGGALPDIVSFSGGLGEDIYPSLIPYDGGEYARDAVAESGKAGGNTYAVPWCMGGYALIAYQDYLRRAGVEASSKLTDCVFSAGIELKNKGESVTLSSMSMGFSAFNNPLYCLRRSLSEGVKGNAQSFSIDYDKTQFSAYDAFVGGYASSILLGTQRDLVRLEGKLQAGKISQLVMQPLAGWTDLVQYCGIVATEDKAKYRYSVKYLEFLQSESAQQKLTALGMINVLGLSFYSSGYLAELESALNGRLTVQNAFTPKARIKELREAAAQELKA